MWPDDYIDWARQTRRGIVRRLEQVLSRRLSTNPQWTEERVSALAEQATRHTFDLANDHRLYPDYCRTQDEFRLWVFTLALNETLRQLIRHRLGQARFLLLSADQRRLLGMRYLDQLPPGDVAGVLHLGADAVREQTRQALDAFFEILGRADTETES